MSVRNLFKLESPFAEARQKLRKAIEAGKVSETRDARPVIQQLLDSLDTIELTLAFEESGLEGLDLSAASVKELMRLLDEFDAESKRNHRT